MTDESVGCRVKREEVKAAGFQADVAVKTRVVMLPMTVEVRVVEISCSDLTGRSCKGRLSAAKGTSRYKELLCYTRRGREWWWWWWCDERNALKQQQQVRHASRSNWRVNWTPPRFTRSGKLNEFQVLAEIYQQNGRLLNVILHRQDSSTLKYFCLS